MRINKKLLFVLIGTLCTALFMPGFAFAESTETARLPHLSVIRYVTLGCAGLAVIIYFYLKNDKKRIDNDCVLHQNLYLGIALILVMGLIIRIVANYAFKAAYGTYGHSTDIRCFSAWGEKLYSGGPSKFYEEGYFADYPPGYIYVLGFTAFVRDVFNVVPNSATHALIVKMPAILCDLLSGFIVYLIAVREKYSIKTALIFASLVVFNPLFIFLSAVWGQIDIVLSVFLVLAFLLFVQAMKEHKKSSFILSGLFYGIALAFKPQALMAGPIYGIAFLVYIFKSDNFLKAILDTAMTAAVAIAVVLIPAIPFTGTQEGLWILKKYIGTATSYPYASIEAFNLMALLNGNWNEINNKVLGTPITYKLLGTSLMVLVILASLALYFVIDKKKKGAIFIVTAFLLSGLFAFGHYMHERYLFPVLVLLLFATLYYRDRRLTLVFGGFTATALLNAMAAFIITDDTSGARYTDYAMLLKVGSVLTILVFVYFTYVCVDLLLFNHGESEPFSLKKLK